MSERTQDGVEKVPLCYFSGEWNKSYRKTQCLQFSLPGLAIIIHLLHDVGTSLFQNEIYGFVSTFLVA